jgi:hypothetical protein
MPRARPRLRCRHLDRRVRRCVNLHDEDNAARRRCQAVADAATSCSATMRTAERKSQGARPPVRGLRLRRLLAIVTPGRPVDGCCLRCSPIPRCRHPCRPTRRRRRGPQLSPG